MAHRARATGTRQQEEQLDTHKWYVFQQFVGHDIVCIDKRTGDVIIIHTNGATEKYVPKIKGETK